MFIADQPILLVDIPAIGGNDQPRHDDTRDDENIVAVVKKPVKRIDVEKTKQDKKDSEPDAVGESGRGPQPFGKIREVEVTARSGPPSARIPVIEIAPRIGPRSEIASQTIHLRRRWA